MMVLSLCKSDIQDEFFSALVFFAEVFIYVFLYKLFKMTTSCYSCNALTFKWPHSYQIWLHRIYWSIIIQIVLLWFHFPSVFI